MKSNSLFLYIGLTLALTVIFAGCTQAPPGNQTATPSPASNVTSKSILKIATTSSLYDTGLLNAIEDAYEKNYAVDLQITSQGTGKAIELAQRGDVDLLLVHSPSQEAAFLEAGYGINQRCIAYNYFIIVGPPAEPAGIKNLTPEAGVAKLLTSGKNASNIFFVSRGDNSGTHTAEKNLWIAAGFNYTRDVQKSGNWYIEAGKTMGETLIMAGEKGGYTLTDEGTYLAFKSQLNLVPIIKNGNALLNRYSTIAVNPVKHPNTNIKEARRFINWLISSEGKQMIGNFGKEKYGKGLFTPLEKDICGKAPFNCDCTTQVTGN